MMCRFNISPNSFFQVNTEASEVLFSTVREWAKEVPQCNTILDIWHVTTIHIILLILLRQRNALSQQNQ